MHPPRRMFAHTPILPPTSRGLSRGLAVLGCVAALGASTGASSALAAVASASFERPSALPSAHAGDEVAVFSGGCFWGVQAVFEHVRGVTGVIAGYAGGEAGRATYEDVSTGATGHAESVRITFDPNRVTYEQLLKVFMTVAHDPTELDRQGPDHGTQYRSVIWYTSDAQKRTAEAVVQAMGQSLPRGQRIVTVISPLEGFYQAEAYHQDYYAHHPDAPYIVVNDKPKVETLRRALPALYQEAPVLYAGASQ